MVEKEFIVQPLEATSKQYTVVLHEEDARSLGLEAGDRVEFFSGNEELITVVDTTRTLVDRGSVGTFSKVSETLSLNAGDKASILPTSSPDSVRYIRKKINGKNLTDSEIHAIVKDIVDGRLTNQEMTAFLVAEKIRDMSIEERVALTQSMVETGETVEFDKKPVLDVHSIGGIPGNKYAMVTVPIVSAAGFTIPKTSSRAITSPAGTPDVMEVFCDVSFSLEEISDIVKDVGGILAWGGAVNLAPADDILVRLERPLSIDPRSQLLASVLSKKLSVGSDEVLIDIPTGLGAKVETDEEAEDLAHDFMNLGHRIGLDVETAVTYGGQPLGYHIGPGLEAREVLKTLQGDGPTSLIEKSTSLAGVLLEMAGEVSFGSGKSKAMEILDSGQAYQKMQDIIEAQGGDPEVDLDSLPLGDKQDEVCAPHDGYVKRINNSIITEVARKAGSPQDKGSGVKLLHKEGQEVNKGDPLLKVFSEHESKLEDAMNLASEKLPVRIETMLLRRISGTR